MKNNTPKVLIIDDDPGVLFLHEIIVTENNLHPKPSTFFDAKNALNYILSIDEGVNRILIFLDINMPKMNGWEFLDRLVRKIKHLDIKVIMVTSSLNRNEREKAKEYEIIIDFWEKPMDEDQVSGLIQKLESWLKGH
ncbi:response regulator [Algoriphagus hitonicola]|uniref:Response regulator receiver domain-containing protein n=1 Tax=Algoriphagus hitonicola TaxID=435880 RepID=A0A1I2VRB9_9BACT|nr:response regulator [Algoriphagus hitonicola]SFG91778.1 Response regulator receiver domain-containing protein [Algoriphagus hitonicola]